MKTRTLFMVLCNLQECGAPIGRGTPIVRYPLITMHSLYMAQNVWLFTLLSV